MPIMFGQDYIDNLKKEHAAEVAKLREELNAAQQAAADNALRAETLGYVEKAVRGQAVDIDRPIEDLPPIVREAVQLRHDRDGLNTRRTKERDRRVVNR